MSVTKNATETKTAGRLTVVSPTGRSADMLCFCVQAALCFARTR